MLLTSAFSQLACLLAFVTCVSSEVVSNRIHSIQSNVTIPNTRFRRAPSNINYFGGVVMTEPINLYYIFYGNFTAAQKQILTDFGNGLGDTPWWGISRKYYSQQSQGATKTYVKTIVGVKKSITDAYSIGKSIDKAQIQDLIKGYIKSGRLPQDKKGIHVFLHSADVTSLWVQGYPYGFCTQYCGYRDVLTYSDTTDFIYAVIGNGDACPSACIPNMNAAASPNRDPGIDGMVSVIAHELTEAVTNPYGDGWFDSSGYGSADKCAWTFGNVTKAQCGGNYNVVVRKRQYLVQQVWDPVRQGCYMR